MFRKCIKSSVTFVLVLFALFTMANGKEGSDETPLFLFLDVDATHGKKLADGIQLGLEAGLAVGAEQFGGPEVIVALRDHRGNMRRTAMTIEEAAENPNTLAMIGGMHSLHYLKHGATINARRLVMMLPWSAGAVLTRLSEGPGNHIFRVSVDDKQAGRFLAQNAVARGCTRLAILALDNGWGRGNAKSIQAHAEALGVKVVHSAFIRRYTQAKPTAAAIAAMATTQPDCTILVLVGQGTAFAANELATWASPPIVLSHWGILSGGFVEDVNPEVKDKLDIGVLGTCALELAADRTEQFAKAFEAVARIKPEIESQDDIPLPIAFAHAYDVGLLLRAGMHQAQQNPRWSEGRIGRSAALREALEALETPVDGLLKLYKSPFKPVADASSDGHEALGLDDLCLIRLGPNGALKPYKDASLQ